MKFIPVIALLTFFTLAPAAFADTFEDGTTAFEAREYKKALNLWLPLAEQGDIASQVNVGEIYVKGLGVTRDAPEALKWFSRAAAQGSAAPNLTWAKYMVTVTAYPSTTNYPSNGIARPHSRDTPVHVTNWAQNISKGEGVLMNYPMAYAWMDMAAKQGLSIAANYRDLIATTLKPDELKKAIALADELTEQLADPSSTSQTTIKPRKNIHTREKRLAGTFSESTSICPISTHADKKHMGRKNANAMHTRTGR